MSVIEIDPNGLFLLPELKIEWPNLYATIKKQLPSLNSQEIAIIMNIAINICGACRNELIGCQCWNDE